MTRPAARAAVNASIKPGARVLIRDRWQLARILPADAAFHYPLAGQLAWVERMIANLTGLGRANHWAFEMSQHDLIALRQARLALRYLRRFGGGE